MSKGSKEILKFNKQFDSNCNNSLGICRIVHATHREYIALKGYWVFLLSYSALALFLIYKPYSTGREYFSTLVMFTLPIIADIVNTKIYHKVIKIFRFIQITILGVITFVALYSLFSANFAFEKGVIMLHDPLPSIPVSIKFIWWVLLITLTSLITNISGAKSPLDEYYENKFGFTSSGNEITA